MAEFYDSLQNIVQAKSADKVQTILEIVEAAKRADYTVVDIDTSRPWGGFVRFDYRGGDRFVEEFFPGVDPVEARLGNQNAELSPKILIVSPSQRLSWQVHKRRAERWVFLNEGAYYKSEDPNTQGELIMAKTGDIVQFGAGECHRLVGDTAHATFVAEIWQHIDPEALSDEDDIIRLADDYKR